MDDYNNAPDAGAPAPVPETSTSTGTVDDGLTASERLLMDDSFKQQYLAGSPVHLKRMDAALRSEFSGKSQGPTDLHQRLNQQDPFQPQQPAPMQQPSGPEGPSAETGYGYDTVRFAGPDTELSFDEMLGLQSEIAELAREAGLPPDRLQPVYDAIRQNLDMYGDDPFRDADTRQAVMEDTLLAGWGPDYDANMDLVIAYLEDHPDVDQLLVDTGALFDANIVMQVYELASQRR